MSQHPYHTPPQKRVPSQSRRPRHISQQLSPHTSHQAKHKGYSEPTPVNPRPVAHSMRPRVVPPTVEELKENRTAHNQAIAEANDQTLYDILEVEPYTPEEEIRRTYKGLLERFNPNGIVIYGLYSRSQAEALIEQLKDAYEIISDPVRRQEYNQKIFPQGLPPKKPKTYQRNTFSSRLQPLISKSNTDSFVQGQILRGELLKRLCQHFEVSLDALHERTKINVCTLKSLEEERYEDLPAEVYLKGFLQQIALALSLSKESLIKDYLQGYRAWREQMPQRRTWS